MHPSVYEFFRKHASQAEFEGKRVLEVGSYNVNGGLRADVERMKPLSYVGTDMRAGSGVDYVIPAADVVKKFGANYFDAVICTEMLEHAEDWRAAIANMKTTMVPGAVIYLTARGPGFPLHDYPGDYWRFTVDDMLRIFADFDIVTCEPDSDPRSPGVFLKARKPALDDTRDREVVDLNVKPVR
jgi:SAM-dependent methyltransferase